MESVSESHETPWTLRLGGSLRPAVKAVGGDRRWILSLDPRSFDDGDHLARNGIDETAREPLPVVPSPTVLEDTHVPEVQVHVVLDDRLDAVAESQERRQPS